MRNILKKIKCKIFICCKSKCSINDDYDTRNNENYIIERVKLSSFV